VALKNWKHAASTPEFIDFKIVDRDAWRQAKQRMTPADDRIDWDYLSRNYPKWRKDGYWIQAYTPFGFDMAHSWIVGTERTLMAISEDPEWCSELFNAQLDLCLALMDKVWDAGYKSMTPCPIDLPKSDQ
jgi:uroporphyrinogen decarboxylase